MDLLELLLTKGYLFQSNEPGFFLSCADTILQYQTWNAAIAPTPKETKAPFGLIYASESNEKGAKILFNQLRKSWQDFSYSPETLALYTSKCNLNCAYCIIGAPEAKPLSFPSIPQIEKAFGLYPVKRVEITGGEPFAEREHVAKILEWLIGRVAKCDVVTNGFAWDDDLWPLLLKCGRNFDLRMRLTLSEDLSHMKLVEFENKILPRALSTPEVKINLNFLPNSDGSGLAKFLKRINQLELPAHITVAPLALLESKFSGPVMFNVENFVAEMIEVIENEDEYLCKVKFIPDSDLQLLVYEPQRLGCRRGKVTLTDQGYALCSMVLREGEVFEGPLETALSSWQKLSGGCRGCEHYPDRCLDAIKAERCFHCSPGCNRCPIMAICLRRCPYLFNLKEGNDPGQIDLQCLGHSMLRVFVIWLLHRNRTWKEIQAEMGTNQTTTSKESIQ